MKHPLRSAVTTTGRRMAGARSLWRANGMREEQFGRPIIGIANSFTQLVPGHVHLHEIGQQVKQRIEACGCFAAEFDTIAVDDGIAMGHDGMLYSLPSREIIADSVEYMANAHCIDALVCISNCDKITPGMLMAAMRLNIPTVFVSGGPMEAGRFGDRDVDLIDAMVMGADDRCSDEEAARIERCACPGCGSCSGMFTANSMNCLTEALGLSLPGNGTIVATHVARRRLFEEAAALIVRNAERYYFEGDDSLLPRSIATKAAFENAMSLDIAMGGSTNTVLHLLAAAQEAAKAAAAPAPAPAKPEPAAEPIRHEPEVDFETFCRVEMLVGQVTACENMKESKKLLKLTVFDGERERTILSGIAKWYEPEELIGKNVAIVANLAPRPMMKGKYVSEGMILSADMPDGGAKVTIYPDDVKPGAAIC